MMVKRVTDWDERRVDVFVNTRDGKANVERRGAWHCGQIVGRGTMMKLWGVVLWYVQVFSR